MIGAMESSKDEVGAAEAEPVGLRDQRRSARPRRRPGGDDLRRLPAHLRYRTRDLLRIATNGTGVLPEGSISRDLVHRLAGEAGKIAEHLLHICIRALDYCPPNDITFGDYLRALITADLDIAPEDETGYRVALIEAFRARGIFPDARQHAVDREPALEPAGVHRQAEEGRSTGSPASSSRTSGSWSRPPTGKSSMALERRAGDADKLLIGKERIYGRRVGAVSQQARADVTPGVAALRQGLREGPLHAQRQTRRRYIPRIEVHTIRPAFRAGREGRQIEQVLVTLTQRVTADVGTAGEPKLMVFRGGCSLILSLGNLNTVEYVILKNIKSYDRFLRAGDYLNGETRAAPLPRRRSMPTTTATGASTSICSIVTEPRTPWPNVRHRPHVSAQRARRLLSRHLHGRTATAAC